MPTIRERWIRFCDPWEAFSWAADFFVKVLWGELRKGNWRALLQPRIAGDKSFAVWYNTLGHHFSASEDSMAIPHLVSSAYGVVLDLGPCTGNQLPRFDRSKLQHVYGVEPNTGFSEALSTKIKELNMSDVYEPIFCGIEDTEQISRHGIIPGSIDTVLCIQVLCSVANPEDVVKQLYELLKPGGELIFFEHHRSHDTITQTAQWTWNLAWPTVVGGCRLNNPVKDIIMKAGQWSITEMGEDEDPLSVIPHVWGRLVKIQNK